jgi:arylmalonate decarboxylase
MTTHVALPPLIGLIVPPIAGNVPTDGPALYSKKARFIARGLGLGEITPTGFASVIGSIVGKARELAAAGAQSISLMGTSLSFYQGAEANRKLVAAIGESTGLPATTMSNAVVRALKMTGVKRVALATAYIDDLNARLVAFLQAEGFEVSAVEGLAVTNVRGVGEVRPERLMNLVERVFHSDRSAQGVLISCGGLLTLDILSPLERRLGVPVVSSSPAGFWDVVQRAGIDPRVPGYGRLFAVRELNRENNI